MFYPKYRSSNIGKLLVKMNVHFIIFLIISNLFLIFCEGEEKIFDSSNIIIFNHTKLNAGSMNKNGDLIIEYYSEENYYEIPNSILFYGLSKNGRYCFSDESSYTQEKNIDIDEIIDISGYYNIYEIYDSKNLFVSLKNDFKREDQYLFSINSYNSIVELHNFNNNTAKNRLIWDFNDFFNLEEDAITFAYERELYELKRKSAYIIAFIPKYKVNENFCDLSFIKKFSFKSFDDNAYEHLKSVKFNKYVDTSILGTFFMDDYGRLVTVSYKEPINPPTQGNIMLNINFFNTDLQYIESGNELFILFPFSLVTNDQYKYFKSFYLTDNVVMFSYITFTYIWYWSWHFINFDLYKIDLASEWKKINPENNNNAFMINPNGFLSDFIKISNIKLVFIYCNYSPNSDNFYNDLIIIIIKINPDYSNFNINQDSFNLENYIPKMQISGYIYNGVLLFTSTAILKEEINNSENDNYFSMLMIFGYPNGTDSTINISDFIFNGEENDIHPEALNNLYKFLFENYTIENYISKYTPDYRIKLISIPEEIIIIEIQLNETSSNYEINELKNNSFMHQDYNYTVKQNKNLIKTSKYYYIDYQYMVQKSGDESA